MTDQQTTTTPETEDRGGGAKNTTYVVLNAVDGAFTEVGRYVVPVGRSDKAKEQALSALATGETAATSFEVVAVPEKSWQPETFQLETPAPRFKRA